MARNIQILILCLLSLVCLSGCNTVKGLGQDVEKMGESMQNLGD